LYTSFLLEILLFFHFFFVIFKVRNSLVPNIDPIYLLFVLFLFLVFKHRLRYPRVMGDGFTNVILSTLWFEFKVC